MISRFFTWGLIFGLFALLMYQISDVTPQLNQIKNHKAQNIVVIPVTITASRRDYPSVVENRGKGFVAPSPSITIGRGSGGGKLYTARHVISDSGYNYFIDGKIPLAALYLLSGDIGSATYSGTINQTGKFSYSGGLSNNQILMGQYRLDHRSWLTGLIISSGDEGIIIDLPVLPGDSGSPVIFSDQTLGIVSQSHSGNQVIVQKITKG